MCQRFGLQKRQLVVDPKNIWLTQNLHNIAVTVVAVARVGDVSIVVVNGVAVDDVVTHVVDVFIVIIFAAVDIDGITYINLLL